MAYAGSDREIAEYWTDITRVAVDKRDSARVACLVSLFAGAMAVFITCNTADTIAYVLACVGTLVNIVFISWVILTAQRSSWIAVIRMSPAEGRAYARELSVLHNGLLKTFDLECIMRQDHPRDGDWVETLRAVQTLAEVWR